MLFLSLFLFVSVFMGSYAQYCVNEQGNRVDWFVLYKLPRDRHHSVENVQKGVAYLYITSDTVHEGWKLANDAISDENSIPGKTLSVIIGNGVDDIFWIFYNDQPPNENYTEKEGHTKGVVVGGYQGGFWMIHSVPKFPVVNRKEGYVYPSSGTVYGQSFLCISLDRDNLAKVGNQLMVNDAKVFESTFQGKIASTYPLLKKAADMERLELISNILEFESSSARFFSYAKSSSFHRDLYSQWLSDNLECTLFVETWLHEDELPSICNQQYPVHNVKEIKWSLSDGNEFNNFKDHSKWAICSQHDYRQNSWICIGDINRASTQLIRGGGTVCFENDKLWKNYRDMVKAVEPCPSRIF